MGTRSGIINRHPVALAAEYEDQRDRLASALADLLAATKSVPADLGGELWTARHRARLALERCGARE